MPWTSLPETLCSAGACMTGWPQVPFPGEIIRDDTSKSKRKKRDAKQADTKQGIKDIGTKNARTLLQAFLSGKIKLVDADTASAKSFLAFCLLPLIFCLRYEERQ